MDVVTYDTPDDVAAGTADRIADLIGETSGRFSLGLAGGSTPEATYEALRQEPIEWERVDAWMSDERWVPLDHDECNGLMATEALMAGLSARFERPRWSEMMAPADSAAFYEATLRSIHHDRVPDLVLLGLGSDGHTASLFPGSEALAERERWYVANRIPETGEQRLTATYPLLWLSKRLLVLATGERKAQALRDSLAGNTPAGQIGAGDSEVEWHVDRAAASQLS